MPLEDRIRSAVDQAVGSLVDQLKQHASEDRDQAVAAAREQVFAEAEQATVVRVADAEARVRATIDELVATRCAEDRAVAARDIRKQLEEELSAKTADTLAAADKRMNLMLADAEARGQEAVKTQVAAARVKERELDLAAVNRLLESIRGLDGATSLSEVLDALALAAGKEAARAAVVVLRSERIQGWKLHGFGARDANPKAIDIPLSESGVIGMAVAAGRPVTTLDSETAAIGPGFQTLPTDRTGLAVPVVVGGRVVAVIYADAVTLDGAERLTPSGWPELIEVLSRHAGRCLEAMTALRAVPKQIPTPSAIKSAAPVGPPPPEAAESRRSSPEDARAKADPSAVPAEDESAAKRAARLLISEIRLYHEPAMHEGRQQKNLLERLGPEIERARKLYDQQVPEDVRTKTDYFHQELVRTLAGGDPSLLGTKRVKQLFAPLLVVIALAVTLSGQQDLAPRLAPTQHPPVPTTLSSMWLAPANTTATLSPLLADFVRGVKLLEDQHNAAAALPLVSAAGLRNTPLADYARYYSGLALLQLNRYDAADGVFAELTARDIEGHLPEDSAFRQAEGREARKDFSGAVVIYESLVGRKLAQPQTAWLKLGLAADSAGNRDRAVEALQQAYYEYPLSLEADAAEAALTRLRVSVDPITAPREFARGEVLFKAHRFSAAKVSYERAKEFLTGLDRERRDLHFAACMVSNGHNTEGRDALKPLLNGALAPEAKYYTLVATRAMGLKDEHVRLVRELIAAHPDSPWVEDALNGLASALIIDDKDEDADGVFREYLDRYPAGRFAERAAWKSGWWAYRQGNFADARKIFDRGAAAFPRSDYRPSWLYWSGRAAEQLGDVEVATARLKLTATDYHNSYYGRIAVARLAGQRGGSVVSTVTREAPAAASAPIPTASRITLLLTTGLYHEALGELHYAQRIWGDSPQLQATIALTERRLGNVRAGINAMKRAYPQYLAAGGETLPREILQVIFPVDYWPLLQKYASAKSLDPYLVAALVAQESNFDPLVKSPANAVGLMQVLPSTGRSYARRLGIKPFSAKRLTEAEVNVRIGTNIFFDTVKKFGGVYFALAAYNAGDSRVAGWQRERPGMPQDEFIDDIPFPETQNYVKRILGTAEDYRKLYGTIEK